MGVKNDKFAAMKSHMQMRNAEDELMQHNEFESKGVYRDIQIELNAILKGDVKARHIKCNGETGLYGNITCESIGIRGIGKVVGGVNAKDFVIHGEGTISGDLELETMNCDGKINHEGNIKCGEFLLNGSFKTNGDISVERITGKGTLSTENLKAEIVDIKINKKSSIKEVKGNNIKIVAQSENFLSKLFGDKGMEITNVEGDEVYLENVRVKTVVGKNIFLGENVIAEEVKCSGELKLDPKAKAFKVEN